MLEPLCARNNEIESNHVQCPTIISTNSQWNDAKKKE